MRTSLEPRARAGALVACLLPVALVSSPAPAAATASGAVQAVQSGQASAAALRAEAPVLLRGSRGAAVRTWQQSLNAWRPATGRPALAVDGVFGPRTQRATLELQRAAGVPRDGVVGPRTRAALARLLAAARPAPAPPGTSAPFEGTVGLSEAAARRGRVAVTGVRSGSHATFDRVVFDLRGDGSSAGWRVRYVDSPVRAQGNGAVVPLRGDAQLQVMLRGIAMPTDVDGAHYSGSERPPLGRTGVVEDLYVGNLYEGVFETWIGTSSPEPFRVFRLEGPPRIVVDVAHGS